MQDLYSTDPTHETCSTADRQTIRLPPGSYMSSIVQDRGIDLPFLPDVGYELYDLSVI